MSEEQALTKREQVTQIWQAVQDLAQEHPDRVYVRPGDGEACFYNPDGVNPDGCIIGAALRRCGYDTSTLDAPKADWPGLPGAAQAIVQMVWGIDWTDVTQNPVAHFETHDLSWFRFVQGRQDKGDTWGEAVGKERAWRFASAQVN